MIKESKEDLLLVLKSLNESITKLYLASKEVLTLEEACIYTGSAKSSLYKESANGNIGKSCPGGKRIFFKKEDLNLYMMKNRLDPFDTAIISSFADARSNRA